MEDDVKGEPDEPKRPVPSRRRGLGRGLGAILSAPAGMGMSEAGEPLLFDELTGLPNRTLLDDRLEEALLSCRQDGASLAVLVVALDGFSKVNELFGHRVGDGLLHDVAQRMSATRRRTDTVARFAGDEFVVVCPYVGSADVACRMAARILEDVSRPASVDGVEHRLSASIGVVVAEPGALGGEGSPSAQPDDRETVEILLGDASLAMRSAKDEGGGAWRLFDPSMREDATTRHQHRQDLRAAMEEGGLFLDYEPIVDVETNALVGASALLGWALPGAVVEGPDALLELVDEAGLAVPVGRWLLDQALSDVAARRASTSLPEEYRVWVKLAPSFVADPTLVEAIDELTAKHRIPSSMLGLDITEPPSSAVPTVDAILQALVVRDVALALDGFGARQSNLMMLQRLPLTAFKLAAEVVGALDEGDGQEGAALVRGLVGLGRALGLSVVAQGVETEAQLSTLRALGCQYAQGPALDEHGRPEPLWATTPADVVAWDSHPPVPAPATPGLRSSAPGVGGGSGVAVPTPEGPRSSTHPSAGGDRHPTSPPETTPETNPVPAAPERPEAAPGTGAALPGPAAPSPRVGTWLGPLAPEAEPAPEAAPSPEAGREPPAPADDPPASRHHQPPPAPGPGQHPLPGWPPPASTPAPAPAALAAEGTRRGPGPALPPPPADSVPLPPSTPPPPPNGVSGPPANGVGAPRGRAGPTPFPPPPARSVAPDAPDTPRAGPGDSAHAAS